MFRPRRPAALALLVLAACGGSSPAGDDDDDDEGGEIVAPITATINGVKWGSTAQTLKSYIAGSHTYIITGAESVTGRAIVLNLGEVTAPGTYNFGTMLPFRFVTVGIGTNVWESAFASAPPYPGTFTVTLVTPTRIVGTFSFTGSPSATTPGATGTATVTNGKFDVTIP